MRRNNNKELGNEDIEVIHYLKNNEWATSREIYFNTEIESKHQIQLILYRLYDLKIIQKMRKGNDLILIYSLLGDSNKNIVTF